MYICVHTLIISVIYNAWEIPNLKIKKSYHSQTCMVSKYDRNENFWNTYNRLYKTFKRNVSNRLKKLKLQHSPYTGHKHTMNNSKGNNHIHGLQKLHTD